jgi:hypothetical protein
MSSILFKFILAGGISMLVVLVIWFVVEFQGLD